MRTYNDRVDKTSPQKTGNDRVPRPDLLQGIDVKSNSTIFSRSGGYISLIDSRREPFTNEIGVYSFDSTLNCGEFEPYLDVLKPTSPENLFDSYSVSYSVSSRAPNSTAIEPLGTVTNFYDGISFSGIKGSAFFRWSRFEGIQISNSSRITRNPVPFLDESNIFGNVKYEGYIKEETNITAFDDSNSYDTSNNLQKSEKSSPERVVVGATGGSDRAEAGHFTIFYGGLYR